ncbi:MAG: alpha/beta fold hydrolase [Alphaproteobacteria bacterium]
MVYENLNFEYIKGKKNSHIKFVLLHGWGHNLINFKPIAKMLNNYDCYLIDLPGFGKSPVPEMVMSISEYSSIIADFIKGIKNRDDKVIIVGHSFGGRIAIDLGANYSTLIDRIVIIAGAGLKKKVHIYKKIPVWSLQKIHSIISKIFSSFGGNLENTYIYKKIFNKIASDDYKNTKAVMREIMKETIKTPSLTLAKKITIPTVLIYGERDKITPPEFGKNFHSVINSSKLFILPTFNHNSILTDGKFQVSSIILKNIGE